LRPSVSGRGIVVASFHDDHVAARHANERAAMPGLRWGRLQLDVRCGLRRGAWYLVLRVERRVAVVYVNFQEVVVPSYALEVVATPPKRWTVVPAPRDAVGLPKAFTPQYAVCPSCRERSPLPGRGPTLRCGRCRGTYDIDRTEGYLSGALEVVPAAQTAWTVGSAEVLRTAPT
jgi:hypothetical protein